ncbi:amino acid adenylation domain-containing protein [Streptomyces sp. NPDC056486]|uniref:amino acid adenylation domain-containing protein n=1 Tax=Streptomyces sp. NPDC056486 TaxID=3345835 RepID=UPI0036B560F1
MATHREYTAENTADAKGLGTPSVSGRGQAVLPYQQRLTERGRGCHALVAALPAPLDTTAVRRRLDEAARRRGDAGTWELWETAVPAPQDAPTARERLRKEALRPVRADTSPVRAVLLRYSDGTGHLVLVADRRRITRTALGRLAEVALSGADRDEVLPFSGTNGMASPAVASTPVDWGLGDPGRRGIVTGRPLTLPRGAVSGGPLLAAVALTTARYRGERTVEVGYLDTESGDAIALLRVGEIDEEQGPAHLLALLDRTQPSPVGAELPGVGLVVSGADDHVYVAGLAPVFPLTVFCTERSDGTVEASAWFDAGAVSPNVAEMFCASVERLAALSVAEVGESPLTGVPVMTPQDTAEVLRLGGAGHRLGDGGRIDRRFDDVARRFPDAVALVDENGELTYRGLSERADAVAAGLRDLGITPATKVGVCLDRGIPLVVALLGVLKAGCAYVPMDFRYPADRLTYIVEDARLPVVIGDITQMPDIPNVRVVGLDELGKPGDAPAATEAEQDGSPDDAAYVIYTSGSTGRPKGVVVPHRNVTALLEATATDFALGPDDVWTLFHSSAFDFSVWEIWGCLLTAGRLVVVSYWTARDTDEFHRLLADQRVTVLNQTPSAFAQLVRADQSATSELSVRLLVFGGEPLDVRLLGPWFARYSPTWCRVVNMFGITETTVHVTAKTITPADLVAGSRSVGRALPGWSLSVRDTRGRVLPPGATGEIYVGGAGVADGYLGRPKLTAQRFVIDEESGERLYRSGDKGRLRPDGLLDHLGRLDNQVKIRGHRIELDEIRSVLAGNPAVTAAVVVANQAPPGDSASSRIDAYVVLDPDHAQHTGTRQVLADARRILPDYMVPSTLTEIAAVPLTANGKPDVTQLPPPAPAGPTVHGHLTEVRTEEPSGRLGEEILDIWRTSLDTDVGQEDNFFELGGNSLLVVHVLTTMRERGLPKIALRDFYANSTAGQFIGLVERARDSSVPSGND